MAGTRAHAMHTHTHRVLTTVLVSPCPRLRRFEEIQKWCVFAFATEAQISAAALEPGGMDTRTNDMTAGRRENLHARRLTVDVTQTMIADEMRMAWVPRTSTNGGAPQMSYEDRKPDPVGVEVKNAADPHQVAGDWFAVADGWFASVALVEAMGGVLLD